MATDPGTRQPRLVVADWVTWVHRIPSGFTHVK